ncbi:MAG TPA: UbiA family prenyltransferase [Acidobacteriaceae bacterium]|jgi:4-hydroxybenzoate polyprenyltransferase|nr:UbiA family prenyltransferase [Acidobacteriaceae bacterium]
MPEERSGGLQGNAGPFLAPGVPLCVDLDGTLVKSDTLVDSVLALARQHPRELLHIPGWIAQGKAQFKRHVTAAVELEVEHLPYNRPLLEWLRIEHGQGRAIYLATAADKTLAERVATFLGIFAGVLASDGSTNLAGGNKLQAFRRQFGERFCYIGNARPDVELLCACESPMTANPHRALTAGLRKANITVAGNFEDRGTIVPSWLRAVRLHQWAKNTLIFVPLLLAHAWTAATLTGAAVAFVSFGLCASATYILNDLLDLEADRKHPRKRKRPFAAGDLSAFAGVAAVVVLMAVALALAILLPRMVASVPGPYLLRQPYKFLEWLGLYTATTLTYSLYLKRKLLLDVFVLSGLYTVRILAGSAATGVPVSAWLAGFSVFFFLSLAFVKRFSEMEGLRERGGTTSSGRGYHVGDLEQLRALGTGAAYAAVVVMTLYINHPETLELYRHVNRLWLVVPVLLLWLSQVWMLASRGQMHDDPVVWAITSPRSLLLGLVMATVVWSAL